MITKFSSEKCLFKPTDKVSLRRKLIKTYIIYVVVQFYVFYA